MRFGGGHLLPATFFSSSSSLLSVSESLSCALLAAGAAEAFWTEAGGGTALYAPANTREYDQHHDTQDRPQYNYMASSCLQTEHT